MLQPEFTLRLFKVSSDDAYLIDFTNLNPPDAYDYDEADEGL